MHTDKNVFKRTSIEIDKTDNKTTIIISPLYKWKSHSNNYYCFLFIYSIFTISNFVLILYYSIYGYLNMLCFLASSLFNRKSSGIVLNIQLILFIPLLSIISDSQNYILTIIGALCIIENLLLGDIRNILIREIFFTTYIEIEKNKHINIESYKFSISKNFWRIWQSDLFLQKKITHIKEKISYETLMKINLNALLNRLKILCVLGSKNSKKIDTYSLLKNKTYFFGYWFTKKEKNILLKIMESQ